MATDETTTDPTDYPWHVVLRPGCYRGPDAPLVSEHRTLAAAVRQARRCDRWQVERADRHGCVWAPPSRGGSSGEAGLYGRGPQPGEPSLAECVATAEEEVARG